MSIIPLNYLNFFLSDVRDGLGPFLGVFLQQHGWHVEIIGLVMTISSLVGMACTTPISILVDRLDTKRTFLILSTSIIILTCCLNYFYPSFYITLFAQILTAIAGAAIAPSINAMTLGIVGPKRFDHQLGQNESYNHAGNAVSAIMAGIFSYFYGFKAVFILMIVWAILSIISIIYISPNDINNNQARGLDQDNHQPQKLQDLFHNKPLILIGLTVTLFHLANAAMLPLLSQAMAARGTAGNIGAYTAATVIIAQFTMIPMALFAAKYAPKKGYNFLFILALVALPIRGLLAGFIPHPYILIPVQLLDGIGAGLMGVAVPGIVARILQGSGRFNAGFGLILTLQGIGASLSPFIAGIIAKYYDYNIAFIALSLIAILGLCMWIFTIKIKPLHHNH